MICAASLCGSYPVFKKPERDDALVIYWRSVLLAGKTEHVFFPKDQFMNINMKTWAELYVSTRLIKAPPLHLTLKC